MPKKSKNAPETFDEHLGAAVDAARVRRRVQQEDLAHNTGIPLTTLRRRLAGTTSFTVAEIERVGATLKVSAGDLVQSALDDFGGIDKLVAMSLPAPTIVTADNVHYLGHVTPPLSAAADTKPRVGPQE
ncbi:MAG TPA: helix-turn-helix transcriptional regulator [Candidatus Lumbricidophila sp.]|nr:helix-turn-helix transcriptional regulator [Candidatus Lumbricidophila sp.]